MRVLIELPAAVRRRQLRTPGRLDRPANTEATVQAKATRRPQYPDAI